MLKLFARQSGVWFPWNLLISGLVAIALGACTIELISDYDETLDRNATALQKDIEAFVIRMGRTSNEPAGLYSKNTEFYDSAKVQLSSMLVRAKARPKNDITVEMLEEIVKQVNLIEALHKKAEADGEGLNQTKARIALDLINVSFTSLLKLELAKRRE